MATIPEIKEHVRDGLVALGFQEPPVSEDGTPPTVGLAFPWSYLLVDEICTGVDIRYAIVDFVNPETEWPTDPTLFDRYIASATYDGRTIHYIYEFIGSDNWIEKIPVDGAFVWVEAEKTFYYYNGLEWLNFGGLLTGDVYWDNILDRPVTFPPSPHDHDYSTVYAPYSHSHDTLYAPLSHNHDLAYSSLSHNHDNRYSLLNHEHDYSLVYAAYSHNHSGVYAPTAHVHAATDITSGVLSISRGGTGSSSFTSGYLPLYSGALGRFVSSFVSQGSGRITINDSSTTSGFIAEIVSGHSSATQVSLRMGVSTSAVCWLIANTAGITFGRGDGTNMYIVNNNFGFSNSAPQYKVDVAGTVRATGFLRSVYTVWDSGNHGPGSGLNADLLDGYDASNFILNTDYRMSDAREPLAHGLVSGYHYVSGLTVGHFLKATGSNTFAFAAHGLTYTDVGAAAAGHDHDNVYATITNVFGGLSQNYIPLYNAGFIDSPLFISGSAVCIGNASGPSVAPTKILFDKSYSNGFTKDKLKISLYEGVGGDMYGFTIGSTGDIQYHSDAYHDFYINNAHMMRISGSLLTLGTRQNITYNSVGTNYSEGNLELVIDGVNSPGSFPLIGFHRSGIDAMSLVYTGGYNLAVRNHLDDTLYNVWTAGNLTGDQTGHYHDSRYYTETELTNGTTALSLSSLALYGVTIVSPDYYITNISQTLTGSPGIYPQLNIYTPGHLNLYADRYINVNSSMIMVGGTRAVIRSARIDLGAFNGVSAGCVPSVTVDVSSYNSSMFAISASAGAQWAFVGASVGQIIIVKNTLSTGVELRSITNNTGYILPLGALTTAMGVCVQDAGSYLVWNWVMFDNTGV